MTEPDPDFDIGEQSPPSSPPTSPEPDPVSPVRAADEPAEAILFEESPAVGSQSAPLGPGLRESLLWILGFFFLEIAGSTVWTMMVMFAHLVRTGAMPSQDELPALLTPVMAWMIGTIKFAEVLAALAAIRLRFGRQAFSLTGFRRVPIVHALILGLAVLPAAVLSGQSFALLQGWWHRLVELAPGLQVFDKLSSIEAVQAMAASTPLAVLVLIIALFPALNEEFVFRAAIGRGLLARYGVIGGIALTSMYFAAVHLNPVHALALLPLSVLMHVGYLSSGSIWAPVGVHFLNNALSVLLMKLATQETSIGGVTTDVTQAPFSPLLFVASAACVAATIWLLLEIRVQWQLPGGASWRPARPSVEPPPAGIDATRVIPTPSIAAVLTTAICYVLYPVALVAGLMLAAR